MTERYATHVQALRRAVLDGGAHTDPALRTAVEAHAAAVGGGAAPGQGPIPAPLQRYVDTVARHAWKVTDVDVDALRQAGYSEDAIFEVTVSAALGAATGRLQRACAALRGAG